MTGGPEFLFRNLPTTLFPAIILHNKLLCPTKSTKCPIRLLEWISCKSIFAYYANAYFEGVFFSMLHMHTNAYVVHISKNFFNFFFFEKTVKKNQ